MKLRIITGFVFPALILILTQCHKENTSPAVSETDQQLYAKATGAGFTYYKNDTTVHASSPQSAHAAFFRVRFNNIAYAALTDSGKLPPGGSFPTGSLIVKELHTDSTAGNILAYAVMEKQPSDTNTANGWLWAEYLSPTSGTLLKSKGSICTNCHSTNSRDMVRVFNLFP